MYTSCKIYDAITTFLKERIQNIETSSLAITQMVAPKHSPRVGTENWASVPQTGIPNHLLQGRWVALAQTHRQGYLSTQRARETTRAKGILFCLWFQILNQQYPPPTATFNCGTRYVHQTHLHPHPHPHRLHLHQLLHHVQILPPKEW